MQTRSWSSLFTAPRTSNDAGRGSDAKHQAPAAQATSNTGVLPPRKSLTQLHALESGSQIERWQESFASEASHEDEGVTTRLFRACLDSLTCILRHTDAKILSTRDRSSLQRCQATLKLWGDGHGVWDGSLDRVVDRSKNLQHMTLAILNPLCKTLSNGMKKHVMFPSNDTSIVELCDRSDEIYAQTKWLLSGFHEHRNDGDSDSDSDSSSGDELDCDGMKSVVEDVKTYTNCLVDLSAALDCPAIDPVHEDEPSQLVVEQRSAQDYHSDLIRAKFPDAKAELVQCLGETSWNRYRRMQQQRETANAQANTQAQPQSGVKSHAADSEFQDSGLGTSLPSVALPTSYAETVISFMTSTAGGKRVQIPPLSAEAKNGAKFECVACGRHVRATTNRDWRKHIFLDLQPYTCFYNKCAWSSQPFANRQLWSNHLELDHKFGPAWDRVECPLCLEVTESGKSAVLIHFARHMEDISLAALPRDVDSDAGSEGESENTSDHTISSVAPDTDFMFDPCDICISQSHEMENLVTHLREAHKTAEDKIENCVDLTKALFTRLSQIIIEIEWLLSDENLRQDPKLRAQMDNDGFIPLEYILEGMKCEKEPWFTKLKELFYEPHSSVFEYHLEGENHKIRQRYGWKKWVEDRRSPNHDRNSYAGLYTRKNEELLYLGRVRCSPGDSTIDKRYIVIWQDGFALQYITKQQGFLQQSDTVISWTEPDGAHMELQFDEPQGCADIWDQIQYICHVNPEARNEQGDLKTASGSPRLQSTTPEFEQWPSAQDAASLASPNLSGSPLLPGGSSGALSHPDVTIDEEELSIIKCICGFKDDDGQTVLCERCETWQHIQCFYESESQIPNVHECVDCRPRVVDREAAAQKQIQHREIIAREEEKRQQRRRNPGRENFRPLLKSRAEASMEEGRSRASRHAASTPAFKARKIEVETRSATTAPARPAQLTSSENTDLRTFFETVTDYPAHDPYDTSGGESEGEPSSRITRNSVEHDPSSTLPYGCSCGRRFQSISFFKRHEKTHAHTCSSDGCAQTFETFDALEKHKTWECQATRSKGTVDKPRESSGVPSSAASSSSFPQFSPSTVAILERLKQQQGKGGHASTSAAFEAKRAEILQNYVTSDNLPSGLDTNPQVLDFEQWAFKPDVSNIPEPVSTSFQPRIGPALSHVMPTVDAAPTALANSETVNQDKKTHKKSKAACAECRASHVKCNFGQPCANCVKRKLPTCTYVSPKDNPELPTIDLKEFAYKPLAETFVADAARTRSQDIEYELAPVVDEIDSIERHEDVRAALEEEVTKRLPYQDPKWEQYLTEAEERNRLDNDAAREALRSMEREPSVPRRKSYAFERDEDDPFSQPLLSRRSPQLGKDSSRSSWLPRHIEDPRSNGRDSGYFGVEQSMKTRDWEAPLADGWEDIEAHTASHASKSATRPSYWDGSGDNSGPSTAGDNDLLAEVKRLRRENEEKETRLRKLESATSLPQERRFSDECFSCGQTGHWANNCPARNLPQDSHISNDECYSCGQTGHWARDCPTHNLSQESRFNDDECYSCGQIGHWASNCPMRVLPPDSGFSSDECYSCGQTGHWAGDCPRHRNR